MRMRTRGVSIRVMLSVIKVSVARQGSALVSSHGSVTLYSDSGSGSDWLQSPVTGPLSLPPSGGGRPGSWTLVTEVGPWPDITTRYQRGVKSEEKDCLYVNYMLPHKTYKRDYNHPQAQRKSSFSTQYNSPQYIQLRIVSEQFTLFCLLSTCKEEENTLRA